MGMQPYVIRQGDHLPALAYQFGFDADDVWNDSANDDLRNLRSDPNLLAPTDVLYIPNQTDKSPATHFLETGQTNTFTSDEPTIGVVVVFADSDRGSQAFTVTELPELAGLSTDGDGCAKFDVPISLQEVSVVFTSDGATFDVKVGHLDPINTLTGAFQRLQNLGYLDPDLDVDGVDVDTVRFALQALQAGESDDRGDESSQEEEDPPPSSGSDDGDGLCDEPFDDSDDTGDVTQPYDYAQDGADSSSTEASSDADASSQSSQDDDSAPAIGDDGTPNDAAQKALLDAHGS
jgi:hypothetical protein